MKSFFGLSLPAFNSSPEAAGIIKKRIILIFGLLFMLAAASNISAAPFEIEGYIKQVRTIETKPPYTFSGKQVISIYIVGHRFGKDFDYQFMVVMDSTQLKGISFSDLVPGKYVRVKSRAEPPGMLGKPIQEIRASRYGCCNYALHIDTIATPQNINALITRVESFGPGEIVVTVHEDKPGSPEFKYLVADGKTTIRNGGFSDIKVSAKIDITNAGINVPVPQEVDHGKLYGADLFATSVVIKQVAAQKEIPAEGLQLWYRADRGVTHSDNKVTQWDDQSGSGLHAKLNRGQPMLLNSAIGGKPAIHFNGKGDVLEFKGWSPNGLTAMTMAIHDGATEKLYVEEELVWIQTDKLTTITNCASYGYIGRWSHGGDNSGWFAGNVAEIIVYTKALSDMERNKVEAYLGAKYFAERK